MNIRIEKVDINNEDVLDFLALENLKMLIDLRPKMEKLYSGGLENKLVKMFVDDYKKRIQNDTTIYGAFFNEEIIGVAEFLSNNYLVGLFVSKEYRNQLIGSRLLERLISECNGSGVIKVDARIDAISLYERFSFKKVGDTCNRMFVPMELEIGNYGK